MRIFANTFIPFIVSLALYRQRTCITNTLSKKKTFWKARSTRWLKINSASSVFSGCHFYSRMMRLLLIWRIHQDRLACPMCCLCIRVLMCLLYQMMPKVHWFLAFVRKRCEGRDRRMNNAFFFSFVCHFSETLRAISVCSNFLIAGIKLL